MPLIAIIIIVVLAVLFFTVFPIGIELPKPRRHYITDILICLNLIVFLAMYARGDFNNLEELLRAMFLPGLDHAVTEFIHDWGLVPSRFSFVNLVSSLFVHAGILHLFGNMYILYIFGLHLEHKLRPLGFLLVYFFGGFAADLLYIYMISPTSSSNTPLVGASGAIFAVMGAFLVHFPKAKVKVWYSIFFFARGTWYVSAIFFLTARFIIEVFSSMKRSVVANPAHMGGFFFGLLVAYISQQLRFGTSTTKDEIFSLIGTDSSANHPARTQKEHETIALMKENITQSIDNPNFGPEVKKEALDAYNRLINSFPETVLKPTTQLPIASMFAERSRFEEALSAYKKHVTAYPNNNNVDEALYQIGRISCDNLDDIDEGKRVLAFLAKEFPDTHWGRAAQHKLNQLH